MELNISNITEFRPRYSETDQMGVVYYGNYAAYFEVGMDLENYFRLNFALMQYHKYSLTEIENMMPWERDIYVILLQQHLEEEELKQKQRNGTT